MSDQWQWLRDKIPGADSGSPVGMTIRETQLLIAERDRLAAENERKDAALLDAANRIMYWTSLYENEREMRRASDARVAALLSSAGPSQEADPTRRWDDPAVMASDLKEAMHEIGPAPGRRCTCGDYGEYWVQGGPKPCPVHGT